MKGRKERVSLPVCLLQLAKQLHLVHADCVAGDVVVVGEGGLVPGLHGEGGLVPVFHGECGAGSHAVTSPALHRHTSLTTGRSPHWSIHLHFTSEHVQTEILSETIISEN